MSFEQFSDQNLSEKSCSCLRLEGTKWFFSHSCSVIFSLTFSFFLPHTLKNIYVQLKQISLPFHQILSLPYFSTSFSLALLPSCHKQSDCFQQQGMNKHASRYLCLNPISCQIQLRFFCISKQGFILTTSNYIFLFSLNLISHQVFLLNSNRTTIVNIPSYDF